MPQAYSNKEPSKSDLDEWFYYQDGCLFWKKSTARTNAGDAAGSLDKDGYVRVRFKGRKVYAHRLIWIMHTDDHPELIDHIDGNKSNNRLTNLRHASKSANAINSGSYRSNKSTGVRGVHKSGNKYAARLWVNGTRLYLGYFDTIVEAQAAYEKAVASHFGP